MNLFGLCMCLYLVRTEGSKETEKKKTTEIPSAQVLSAFHVSLVFFLSTMPSIIFSETAFLCFWCWFCSCCCCCCLTSFRIFRFSYFTLFFLFFFEIFASFEQFTLRIRCIRIFYKSKSSLKITEWREWWKLNMNKTVNGDVKMKRQQKRKRMKKEGRLR